MKRKLIFDINRSKTSFCPSLPPLTSDIAASYSSADKSVSKCVISLEGINVLNRYILTELIHGRRD